MRCVGISFFLLRVYGNLGLTNWLRGAEDALSVSGRQRSKLSVKGCGNSGFGSKSRFEVIYYSNPVLLGYRSGRKQVSQLSLYLFQMSPLKLPTVTGMELVIDE